MDRLSTRVIAMSAFALCGVLASLWINQDTPDQVSTSAAKSQPVADPRIQSPGTRPTDGAASTAVAAIDHPSPGGAGFHAGAPTRRNESARQSPSDVEPAVTPPLVDAVVGPKTPSRPLPSSKRLAERGGGAGISDELRNAMDRMAIDLGKDLEPSVGPDGEIEIRVGQVTDGSLLDEVGLRPGDVIDEIGGAPIADEDSAQRMLRDAANCLTTTARVLNGESERMVTIPPETLRKFGCVE